jgi:subtilisin family serine protease
MLKHFILMCCLLLPLWAGAQRLSTPRPLEGQVVVKLVPEAQGLSSGRVRLRWPDALRQEAMEPLFAAHESRKASLRGRSPQQRQRAGEIGIERLYRLRLPAGMDVQEALALLSGQPEVAYAEPIYPSEPLYVPNDTDVPNMWTHRDEYARVFSAWDISKGDPSVVVGVIDTGCRIGHPDLAGQLQYNNPERYGLPGIDDDFNGYVDDSIGYDFANRRSRMVELYRWGHGTPSAFTIAGTPNNAFGAAGTGHSCRVMPLQVMKTDGATVINEYEALLYAAENGCRIANLSLGRTGPPTRYEQEIIDYVTEVHDLLVVASAGNSGRNERYYPASYEHVLSVGVQGGRSIDGKAWATYNHWIDLVAPGEQVRVAYYATTNDHTGNYSGSSAAAPFVSGIAGLVRAKYPELRADQVAAVLRQSANPDLYAQPYGRTRPEQLGRGRVDALAAVSDPLRSPALLASAISTRNTNPARPDAFRPGDTLALSMDFTSLLKPVQGASVSLTCLSAQGQVLQGSCAIGALGTLQAMSNAQSPFLIRLSDSTAPGVKLLCRLGYSDPATGYQDFQYIEIETISTSQAVDFVHWAVSVGNNGRIGYTGAGSQDIGLEYRAIDIVQDAGLVLASQGRLSDCLWIDSTARSNDFFGAKTPRFDYVDYAKYEAALYAQFNDYTYNEAPLGVDVEHRVIGWWGTLEDYGHILLEYDIRNTSEQPIEGLTGGLYFQWAFPADSTVHLAWVDSLQMACVQSGGRWIGVVAYHRQATYSSMDLSDPAAPLGDGHFSDAEKAAAISGQLAAGGTVPGMQAAQAVGGQLGALAPGRTAKLAFGLVGGRTLEELAVSIQASRRRAEERYARPAPTFSNVLFCPQDPPVLQADSPGLYRFYADSLLTQLLHEGESYPIPRQRMGRTLYAVDVSSVLPSPATAVTPRWEVGRPGVPPRGPVVLSSSCVGPQGWVHFRGHVGGETFCSVRPEPGSDLSGLRITAVGLSEPGQGYFYQQSEIGWRNSIFFLNRLWHLEASGASAPAGKLRVYFSPQDLSTLQQAGIERAAGIDGTVEDMQWFLTHAPGFSPQEHADDGGIAVPYRILDPSRYGIDGGIEYVEFDGLDGLAGTLGAMITVGGPLPISLVGFEASAAGARQVLLQWETAQEKDHAYFQVERSRDGKSFLPIGKMPSKGDSDQRRAYEFRDREALEGLSYYRLAMVGTHGDLSYSPVEAVRPEGRPARLSAYPNPASGEVRFVWPEPAQEGDALLVYGIDGVLRKRIGLVPGQQDAWLQADWPAGSYLAILSLQGRQLPLRWVLR